MKAFVLAGVLAAVVGMAAPVMGQTGPIAGKNAPGLPGSQANLAAAKEKLNTDKDKLDSMMKHRQDLLEQSPAYADAQKNLADAVAADKAAKDAVLAKLAAQKPYADAKAKADAADLAAKGGTPDQAKAALDADGMVSKMVTAAFSADDGVKTADANLATARAALKKMTDDLANSVKYDKNMVAQRDAIAKDQQSVNAWDERVQQLEAPKKKK